MFKIKWNHELHAMRDDLDWSIIYVNISADFVWIISIDPGTIIPLGGRHSVDTIADDDVVIRL